MSTLLFRIKSGKKYAYCCLLIKGGSGKMFGEILFLLADFDFYNLFTICWQKSPILSWKIHNFDLKITWSQFMTTTHAYVSKQKVIKYIILCNLHILDSLIHLLRWWPKLNLFQFYKVAFILVKMIPFSSMIFIDYI